MRTTLLVTFTAAAIGLATSAAFGCAKDHARASQAAPEALGVSEAISGSVAGQPGEVELADQEKGQSHYDEAEFKLSLQAVGTYSANKAGSAEIVLEAKTGFKCNDKYPYKYKVEKTDGVRFQAEVIRQDAVQVSHDRSVMKLDFVPESAGKKRLTGTFYFSVCTEDKCLVERRKLSLDIPVGES